jgi:uracil-DNA glycosylase
MQCIKRNLEKNGVLLLNISLIFTSKKKSNFHLKQWMNFTDRLLNRISDKKIELILFGKVAQKVEKFSSSVCFDKKFFPHPYNIGFITNDEVINLFKPMKLICI